MKKLLDTKFLFILGLSILVLIGLGIATFYLFDDSDSHFIKSGYVINPLSSKTEKYFFEEETSYHENLSSMIEFKDSDNNNVTILKDSFLHYNDGGMSFLKKGAILDLNSINGKDAVLFYNITDDSIIEKESDNYVIKTTTNDIILKKFIGRINDNKYIVTGNLELKVPGNNATIKGEYFEIVYTENGIVNIENRESKYQVTAEGTYIYSGDILIDLGNKKIVKGKEDIMSITAITIDGDENIEIIPKAKPEKTTTANNGGNNGGNGQNGKDNNQGNNNGQAGTNTETKENNLKVTIQEAEVTSTDLTVKFAMENAIATDRFSMRVTNLENGEVVKKFDSIKPEQTYNVPFLTPNTKYLVTVINESDNSKYVQKIIETNSLGITIEKSFATENSLGYQINISEDSQVTSAKLILMKFDEETGKTEPVKDEDGADRIIELNNLNSGQKPRKESFTDLESDSIYTAVLTDFAVSPYQSNYELSVTAMTLKKTPDFGKLVWNKNKTEQLFTFSLSGIIDDDNAIRKYTYTVYPKNQLTFEEEEEQPVTIITNTAAPVNFEVGEGKLSIGKEYYYRAVIEYFDNEKILEYVSENYDDYIVMETEPYVTLEPNKALTSYNSINGTLTLIDKSCLLNSNNSDECSSTREALVQIYDEQIINVDETSEGIITKRITFTPDENDEGKLKATLEVGGLEAGIFYNVIVKGTRTDMPERGSVPIEYTPNSARGIKTKSLSTFVINWYDQEGNDHNIVNVTSQIATAIPGEITDDESALAIKRVELYLYEGKVTTEMIENRNVSPIAEPVVKLYTNNFDIKERFYDNSYPIGSNDTFGLDKETLASKSADNKIQEYYTLYMRAYYDERGSREIELTPRNKSHNYRVNDALRRDDVGVIDTTITPIYQGNNGPFTNLSNKDTVIGYNIQPSWENAKLLAAHFEPKKVRITVYNKSNNPLYNNKQVSFYKKDGDNLVLVNEIYENVSSASYQIFMSYGKEEIDNIMRRGNEYYIGFELEVLPTNEEILNPTPVFLPRNESGIPKYYGVYKTKKEEKDTPVLKTYVSKSTASSITYWYELTDPDNALYRENADADFGLYYSVDGVENIIPITSNKSETTTYDHFSTEEENTTYNYFTDYFTIPNLTKGDYYALYFKNGNEDNIYPKVTDDTLRLFEGEYTATDHNFKFTVINNELVDNQVKIKILADDEFLPRITNYKVTFTTKKADQTVDKTITSNFRELTSCYDDIETNRCIIVDYQVLKNAGMKSTASSTKIIYVDVEAMYDTGLTGFDYKIGDKTNNPDDFDFEYMIMQDNNTKAAPGNYVAITEGRNNNNYLTYSWKATSTTANRGYYRYKFRKNSTKVIEYTNYYVKELTAGSIDPTREFREFSTGIDGRKVTLDDNTPVILNPKMLLNEQMSFDDRENEFHFNSFTPEITVEKETDILNGAAVTITLSGADYLEFCEESAGDTCVNRGINGNYNLYIDVWDKVEDIGQKDKIVRPTIPVSIDNSNLTKPIEHILIDKLKDSTKYYYRVYAYLNKNNIKTYTQLFDKPLSTANKTFTTRYYDITTWTPEKTFTKIDITSELSSNENRHYGDRVIKTTIGVTPYNSVAINYDVSYTICDSTLTPTECNPDGDSELIFLRNNISASQLKVPTHYDSLPIDKSFEHGKQYKAFLYATYEYYDNYAENHIETPTTKNLYLGGGNRTIEALKRPNLNDVTRDALLIEGEPENDYVIDITPNIIDIDEVLDEGHYYVKLLTGNNVSVGDMQVMQNGSYVTVSQDGEYVNDENLWFDMQDINNLTNPVRISGLNENTIYYIVVYGWANLNNYDPEVPVDERRILVQTDPPIMIYSADENGIAFGKIEFTLTKNSLYVTFLGGTNVNSIEKIECTIGRWLNYDPDNEAFYDETQTYYVMYTVDAEHPFTSDDSKNPQYILSPPGMDLSQRITEGSSNNGNANVNDAYPTIVNFYLKNSDEVITRIGTPLFTNK